MEDKIYIIILLLLSAGAMWLELFNINSYIKKIILSILLIIAIFVGNNMFPYSNDYSIYNGLYYRIANDNFEFFYSSDDNIIDYGFLYVVTLIKSFGGDIYDVYVVVCAICMFIYYYALNKYTVYILIPWYMIVSRYFENQNIIQIRQGLAVAVMLLSLKFAKERRIIPFVLIIIIAASIHKTLIIALCIYPLNLVNWTKLKIIYVYMLIIFLSLLPITNIVFEYVLPTAGIVIDKWDAYKGTVFAQPMSYANLASRLIVFSVFLPWLYKRKNIGYNNIFFSMSIIGMILLSAFNTMAELSGRLSSIFVVATFFAPSVLLEEYSNMSNKVVLVIFFMVLGLILFIRNQVMFEV